MNFRNYCLRYSIIGVRGRAHSLAELSFIGLTMSMSQTIHIFEWMNDLYSHELFIVTDKIYNMCTTFFKVHVTEEKIVKLAKGTCSSLPVGT
jgi:hypothetical protein